MYCFGKYSAWKFSSGEDIYEERKKLQRVENSAWRRSLETHSYMVVEALREEVGYSAVIGMNIRNK